MAGLREGEAKLMDFGVARNPESKPTLPSVLLGDLVCAPAHF